MASTVLPVIAKYTPKVLPALIISTNLSALPCSFKYFIVSTKLFTLAIFMCSIAPADTLFTVEFTDALTESVGVNGTIVVTYSATLNENAVIGEEGNENNTSLDYGDNHNTESIPTKTYTYRFDVVKTKKSNEVLEGAGFELYDAKNNQVKVVFVKKENGVNVYRVTKEENATGALIEAGVARIEGLDSGTYTLKETQIPEGYNKLGENPTITITGNNDATVESNLYKEGGLQVINYTGSELPSTGGMGTKMFITIGSLMVMAFGTLLITKLRMAKENN